VGRSSVRACCEYAYKTFVVTRLEFSISYRYGVISSSYYGCKVQGGLNMNAKVSNFDIRAWIQDMTGL
jgi:hypothetical protein